LKKRGKKVAYYRGNLETCLPLMKGWKGICTEGGDLAKERAKQGKDKSDKS